MTSSDAAAGLRSELSFTGARPPAHPVPHWQCDFDRPSDWPDLPFDAGSPRSRHDLSARAPLAALLDRAFDRLATRVPDAAAFVAAQVDRVVLRVDPGTTGASSGSHRSQVGRCLIVNLQVPADPLPIAMEALLHEAIHQALYRREAAAGPLCDRDTRATFRSPWTGARLPLHSLVHAAFVWFGLAHAWAAVGAGALAAADVPDAIPAPAPAPAEAAHARARCAHGLDGFAFLGDLLDAPGFPRDRIAPGALAALRGCVDVVERAVAATERVRRLDELVALRSRPDWSVRLARAFAGARDFG